MRIETQNYNDVTVVEMQGEFTEESIKTFHDTISSVFASGCTCLVLDMTRVNFIDSLALEELLQFSDDCKENNRQFKLAGLEENCAMILEITRLAPQFDIYEEVAQAVKSFV